MLIVRFYRVLPHFLLTVSVNIDSHLYGVIVWVRVVLKRTVLGDCCFNNLSKGCLQSQLTSVGQMMVL